MDNFTEASPTMTSYTSTCVARFIDKVNPRAFAGWHVVLDWDPNPPPSPAMLQRFIVAEFRARVVEDDEEEATVDRAMDDALLD